MHAIVGRDLVRAVGALHDAAHATSASVAEARARLGCPLDEEVVEPRSLREVGDRPVVLAIDVLAVAQSHVCAGHDFLDDGGEIEGQQRGGTNADRAAAGLVAREARAVEQQHIAASLCELARSGTARRARADDDYFVLGLVGHHVDATTRTD